MDKKKDDEKLNRAKLRPETKKQNQKAEESFKKLVKTNGEALKRLSQS